MFDHGGYFATDEYFKYIGEETTNWSCDPDRWSYFEMLGSLKEMGYISVKELWYSIDNSVINMVNMANHYGKVHLFVVHGVNEAEVVDNIVESEGGVHRLLGSADSSHVGDTTIVEKEGEVVDKEKWANDEVGAEHVCECEVVLGTKIVFRDPVVESLPYYEVEVGGEVVGEGLGQCEVQIRGEAVGEGLRLCEVQVGGEVVGEGLTF